MKYKNRLIHLILLFAIFTPIVFSAEELNDSQKLEKIQEYNDIAFNTYIILSALFGLLLGIAFMMILVYHDWKSALIFLIVVGIMIGIYFS